MQVPRSTNATIEDIKALQNEFVEHIRQYGVESDGHRLVCGIRTTDILPRPALSPVSDTTLFRLVGGIVLRWTWEGYTRLHQVSYAELEAAKAEVRGLVEDFVGWDNMD